MVQRHQDQGCVCGAQGCPVGQAQLHGVQEVAPVRVQHPLHRPWVKPLQGELCQRAGLCLPAGWKPLNPRVIFNFIYKYNVRRYGSILPPSSRGQLGLQEPATSLGSGKRVSLGPCAWLGLARVPWRPPSRGSGGACMHRTRAAKSISSLAGSRRVAIADGVMQ